MKSNKALNRLMKASYGSKLFRAFGSAAPAAAKKATAAASAGSRFPTFLVNTPETKVTPLANGIRVATEEGYGETATIGVWVNTGSRYENEKNNGVAHFLEHMSFKGTERRSRTDIELEVENMGGHLNAYTSREQTVFHARVFKKDVPKAVDLLSDILQNSKFDHDLLERERGVILREMEEVNNVKEELMFDHLHSVVYNGHPLGYTILGPEKNIRSIARTDIVDYVKTHYTGPRIVVAAAGAIKHDEIVKLAGDAFGKLPGKDNIDLTKQPLPDFTGSSVIIRNDDLPVAHVCFAVEGVSWSDPRYFTFMVLQAIVGSWDRALGTGKNSVSRLGELVAEEELAHSFHSFNTCYNDTGLFGLYYVSPGGEHLEDMSFEVLKEWVRIGQTVTDKEVERAKNKLKASVLMQLDSSGHVAEDIGRQMLTLGRRMTAAETFLRIDAITADTVKAVAREKLFDVDLAVSAMGPTKYLPDLNHLRGWTYWNRL